MLKKCISIILSITMMAITPSPVFAETLIPQTEAALAADVSSRYFSRGGESIMDNCSNC